MAVNTEQTAMQARGAAAAFEAAFMMTVPPPVIAANRTLLAALVATNFFGQNSAAIAVTEAQYMEMWAQDAVTMYNYAAASAIETEVPPITSSPQTTTPDGVTNQAQAVSQAASQPASQTGQTAANATTQLASSNSTVPQMLQQVSVNAAAAPQQGAAAAQDPPWWSGWLTIPTPDNPMGLNPSFFNTLRQGLQAYFGVGLGAFGYQMQQQLTFGIGTTAGGSGAWYPTPQFAGLSALGGGHPGGVAATAHLASSAKVGGLSVPSTWGGVAPAAVEEQAVQATMVNYATSAAGPANNGILQGMPMTGGGRRAAAGFTHKYGFKRNVLVRPPPAG
ncbi:putative PPE family protein PPE45 [Mycobacterium stomatepiae]|uniref:Putative PPE family protein PPE45 n=2 Tax=Mycobacterium stomatepiae TaxID=470076 RepID=A0A7I7Q2Y8_9MYCO|nr:putative PPE family protein PPE45 [Mycobacterium stomatepiae]